jgi:hypothetical protein
MDQKCNNPILMISALILIIVLFCIVARSFFKNNDGLIFIPGTDRNNEDKNPQNMETLGNKKCISKFKVERNDGIPGTKIEPEIPSLDLFQAFTSGAFFGRMKNYTPDQNQELAPLVDQLMKEQKIPTYEHLWADVCLYDQDLYNPQDGATLNYYVEHYYCTNSCQTGKYSIRVDLDPAGNFVGYRYDFSWTK